MQKIGSFVGKVTNPILRPESAIPAILLGTVTLLTVSGALVVLALFSPILAYVLIAVAAIVGLLACISFIRHCRGSGVGLEKIPILIFCDRFRRAYVRNVKNNGIDLNSTVGIQETIHAEIFLWLKNNLPILTDIYESGKLCNDRFREDTLISTEQLVIVLQYIRTLSFVSLVECPFFDENCCRVLVKKFPELQYLVLAQNNQINDSFLGYISELKSLTVLDLVGCPNITGAALLACVEKCPNLEELFLPESDGIGEGDVIKLITRMPALKALNIPANRITVKVRQVAEECGIVVRNSTSPFSPVMDALGEGDPNAAGGQINPL
jgi:hypothetical protein